jgi:hypothetical protein
MPHPGILGEDHPAGVVALLRHASIL